MTRRDLLAILPPPKGKEQTIVASQDVDDIMREVVEAHVIFAHDYDLICRRFAGGSVEKRLYDFCKKNLDYDVESENLQTTRSPSVLLTMGKCDCKGYAGFIAGVLDALNRAGLGAYDWSYRFAAYGDDEDTPGHVYVVVRKDDSSETWIDPVLDQFNKRHPVPIGWVEKTPPMSLVRMSGAGGVDPCGYGSPTAHYRQAIGSAQENDLLQALKSFEMGLYSAVGDLQAKGQIGPGIDTILENVAAQAIPEVAEALAIAKQVQAGISNTFGPGSVLTRIADAALSGNILLAPINIIKAAFTGRTFNQDQYFGAMDYFFYVKGINKQVSTNVSDADVLPALKWFEIKTGVFVSCRIHINALRNGPDAYLALHAVNAMTTQDRIRVTYASKVVQQYMPANSIPSSWANAIGVYDDPVTAAIFNARKNNTMAQTDTEGTVVVDVPTTISEFASSNPLVTVGIVAAAAFLLYELFKD